MEPVPETKRMEEFRPLPSLRIQSPLDALRNTKPHPLRRSTEPLPSSSPTSPSWSPTAMSLPFRPRAASPLSISHTRSKSTTATLAPPPMVRTQSLPGVHASGHMLHCPQLRPRSPSGSSSPSPSRVRVPRKHVDEAYPSSPTRLSVIDHDNHNKSAEPTNSSSPGLANVNTGRIRRPSSPFRHHAHSSTLLLPNGISATLLHTPSTASSPSHRASYDLASLSNSSIASYPYTHGGYLSFSVPSTPTSTRSRSPSISSLETIPDSPDAEEAALEAERVAQLKAAAEAVDGEPDTMVRSSLDVSNRGRTLSGFGLRDKGKRWSVCGAERRQDLDLETIWED